MVFYSSNNFNHNSRSTYANVCVHTNHSKEAVDHSIISTQCLDVLQHGWHLLISGPQQFHWVLHISSMVSRRTPAKLFAADINYTTYQKHRNYCQQCHPCDTHVTPMWHPRNTHPCGIPVTHVTPMWHPCDTHVTPMWHCNIPVTALTLSSCVTHVTPMWHPCDTHVTL